jgi:hypothetical protein
MEWGDDALITRCVSFGEMWPDYYICEDDETGRNAATISLTKEEFENYRAVCAAYAEWQRRLALEVSKHPGSPE